MQSHVRSVAFVFLLASAVSGTAAAGERACTVDADFYATQAKKLAGQHPGAAIDKVTGTVSWASTRHGQVQVQVGGCQHFGLRVRSTPGLNKASEQAVRSYAAEMVQSYLPKALVKQIAAAIRSAPPSQKREKDGQVTLEFAVGGFQQVVLGYRARGPKTEIEVTALAES